MKALDALLGRTRPVKPDLDRLFALPGAAVTIEAALGRRPTGRAGVCFKPATASSFDQASTELTDLLRVGSLEGRTTVSDDSYGYRWVVFHNDDIGELVTDAHLVNSNLADAGYGPQLLCSAFPFATSGADADLIVVYLYKRGSFYPFAPRPGQTRDTELELRFRAELAHDLPVESDLERWFPIWDSPVGPRPAPTSPPPQTQPQPGRAGPEGGRGC